MSKTEGLKSELRKISHKVGGVHTVYTISLSSIEINQILKACKEAGLKFARDGCIDCEDKEEDAYGCVKLPWCNEVLKIEEIEID